MINTGHYILVFIMIFGIYIFMVLTDYFKNKDK